MIELLYIAGITVVATVFTVCVVTRMDGWRKPDDHVTAEEWADAWGETY
jgi:hypothetical protein